MWIIVVHVLHPYGLSVECILFKCHKCIVNHQFDKNIYGLRLPTWIKIFIKRWNLINIHQSYNNGLKKWIYGL
jgi:hypothetical protein